jgi:hypothetical protein
MMPNFVEREHFRQLVRRPCVSDNSRVFHQTVSSLYRAFRGPPSFRVYGKAAYERDWHMIDVYATHWRDCGSRWPLFRGTCITWTSSIIAVGCDFAEQLLREQLDEPVSREFPLVVAGGRLRDGRLRSAACGPSFPSASEVMAHECGHTGQARRMGFLYWLIGAMVTQCREGKYVWNRFENQASETGMFGGIVKGSVHAGLIGA